MEPLEDVFTYSIVCQKRCGGSITCVLVEHGIYTQSYPVGSCCGYSPLKPTDLLPTMVKTAIINIKFFEVVKHDPDFMMAYRRYLAWGELKE